MRLKPRTAALTLILTISVALPAFAESSERTPSEAPSLEELMVEARSARLEGNRDQAISQYRLALREAENTGSRELGPLLDETSEYFESLGSSRSLQAALSRYVETLEEQEGRYDPTLLQPLVRLHAASLAADNFDRASSLGIQIIEILERNRDLDSESVVSALYEVHQSYVRYARYDDAHVIHGRFDRIIERHSLSGRDLAQLYDEMARMHLGPTGSLTRAERYWQRSLDAWEATAGPQSEEAREMRANLAGIQQRLAGVEVQ